MEVWQLVDMYKLEGLKYVYMGAMERGLCKENASEILNELDDFRCPCEGLWKI